MTMTPWNLPHGQWSKKLTMTTKPSICPWSMAGVDRGRDFRPRPRPRKIQLVKTEAEDNRGFFFLAEAEAEECKF